MLARAGYDPYAAVTLQETFLKLSEGREQSWLEGMFASHPPSAERVNNNKGLVETLRAEGFTGGEYGADRYQAAMRQLVRDKPAYADHDAAKKGHARRQLGRSAFSAGEGVGRLRTRNPRSIRCGGDIRYRQERYGDAIINYSRAIERSDGFLWLLSGSRDGPTSNSVNRFRRKSDLKQVSRIAADDDRLSGTG